MKIVTDLVNWIRKEYRSEDPIIPGMDSGFFDEINWEAFEGGVEDLWQ